MTVLERFKIELANKGYFSDDILSMYLTENNLQSTDTYEKNYMQYNLLAAVVDVLEALSNDIDMFRRVETEFATISEAYKHLEKRISDIKRRMLSIEDNDNTGVFTMLFRRG